MGGGVTRMIQSLPSTLELIAVPWMLKAMYVVLLPYLALKEPLITTISMYFIIHQSNASTDT